MSPRFWASATLLLVAVAFATAIGLTAGRWAVSLLMALPK